MNGPLSTALLAALLPALAALAFTAPPALLLVADLPLTALQGQWELNEILFDPSDLVLAALLLAFAARGVPRARGGSATVPGLRWWLLLGGLLSIAYLAAPINAPVLDSWSRIAYQLYRYCWRPIAWFVLAAVCIRDRRRLGWLLAAIVVSGVIFSLPAIAQGYGGDYATGPFSHKNELGAALLAPLLLALAGAVSGRPPGARLACGVAALIIGRALMFALSRGATVAALAGAALLCAGLLADRRLRRAVLTLLPLALLAGVVVLLKSDRPVVAELLTASAGTEDANMQFRIQERWPHFAAIIAEHPWLGTGDGRDLTLGEEMNTPHNGYLSLALISGIPAATLTIGFALAGLAAAWRLQRGADGDLRVLGLAVAATLVALLIHNLIDATLLNAFAAKVYWLLIGVTTLAAQQPARFHAAPTAVSPARPRAALAPAVAVEVRS
ncbi:MAG: O-antigen ligase family protein [Deltaproteobacteria bacterium]|nr:O-antigen ligase family protein [Deltaproteobacteria bacterium]